MEVGSFDDRNDCEHSGVGYVEISEVLVTQNDFSKCWHKVWVVFHIISRAAVGTNPSQVYFMDVSCGSLLYSGQCTEMKCKMFPNQSINQSINLE